MTALRMVLCAPWPRRRIPRVGHKFWPEPLGQGGIGFVGVFFREGRGNCFDWPSCYSSFESTGLFSGILFNRSSLSRTRIPLRCLRAFSRQSRRQRALFFLGLLGTVMVHFHPQVFVLVFNLLPGWECFGGLARVHKTLAWFDELEYWMEKMLLWMISWFFRL